MKKLIFPLFILIAAWAFTGCSEKFNVAAPYKNITVIYAFLDMNDTAHYVRIEKAFLDQNISAVTMAKTADSSYYSHINVKIKRLNFLDSSVHDTIHLNRVDLTAEGYPKQPGVFFTAPNYAYKFTNVLDPNYIYRIVVTNQITGKTDSAEAPIIDDTNDGKFESSVFSDTGTIDFNSTLARKSFEFYCRYNAPALFSWRSFISPVAISQAIIRFNWQDSNFSTHTTTAHSFDYDAGVLTFSTGQADIQIDYIIPDLLLFNAVNSGLGQAPPDVVRLLDKCDLFVYLSTQDFVDYQQNSLIQGVGLTGSEIEPVYSNIKGADALGLFTSRGMRHGLLKLTDQTIDTLQYGTLNTRNNIRGRVH
jgi:hypothetical protein